MENKTPTSTVPASVIEAPVAPPTPPVNKKNKAVVVDKPELDHDVLMFAQHIQRVLDATVAKSQDVLPLWLTMKNEGLRDGLLEEVHKDHLKGFAANPADFAQAGTWAFALWLRSQEGGWKAPTYPVSTYKAPLPSLVPPVVTTSGTGTVTTHPPIPPTPPTPGRVRSQWEINEAERKVKLGATPAENRIKDVLDN